MRTPVAMITAIVALATLMPAPSVQAEGEASRDPRNWPTVNRLVADRHELAGRVVTLRVFAREVDYFNCGYRHARGSHRAFTLLGGPMETLTGYVPEQLGELLASVLEKDPWTPITVQVRFDPDKLSDQCQDQVDVLKWSLGWQYPPESISPERPDPTVQPTPQELDEVAKLPLWDLLMERKPKGHPELEELQPGDRVQLTGGARLARAYHCMFKGAARTHYVLRMHDGRGDFVHAYIPKNKASRELVDTIALHRDVLLTVQGKVVRQALSHYCRNQLEVTGWSFPERRHEDAPAP